MTDQRPKFIVHDDGRWLTEDEIFEDLKTRVAPETQRSMAQLPEGGGIYHHGFGTWIRNSYGLWIEGNPITARWAEEQKKHIKNGVDYSPSHPDNVSGRIINRFIAWLKESVRADA